MWRSESASELPTFNKPRKLQRFKKVSKEIVSPSIASYFLIPFTVNFLHEYSRSANYDVTLREQYGVPLALLLRRDVPRRAHFRYAASKSRGNAMAENHTANSSDCSPILLRNSITWSIRRWPRTADEYTCYTI